MQKITNFLKEVKEVFHNISWPKKEALIQLTIVVISISIVISLILGGFDYLFTQSFAMIGNLNNQPSTTVVQPTAAPTLNPLPTAASATGTIKK